jgi:predicted  nucleic acid-binding Zn-ribbon protein
MTKREIEKRLDDLREQREKIAESLEDLEEQVSGLNSELDDFIQDKTERWQEGETGSAYCDLRDELEAFDWDLGEIPELNL